MAVRGQNGRISHSQLVHKLLVLVRAGNAVQASEAGQNRLHLRRSQYGPVDPVPFHNGNPPIGALRRYKGNARFADVFDIPVDGSPGYFKLLGQIGCSHLFLLQKDRQDSD